MTDHPLASATPKPCDWCTAGTPIVFARTRNDKTIPIEHTPDPTGNVEISWTGTGIPFATVHIDGQTSFDDMLATSTTIIPGIRYMPHHARCSMDLLPPDDPRRKR